MWDDTKSVRLPFYPDALAWPKRTADWAVILIPCSCFISGSLLLAIMQRMLYSSPTRRRRVRRGGVKKADTTEPSTAPGVAALQQEADGFGEDNIRWSWWRHSARRRLR